MTAPKLEELIKKLIDNGHSVKGFLFCNPSNPLGEVYSLELALELMKVCAKFQMHFLSDEVYAMSVYDTQTKFKSILSIPNNFVPDPIRTHFLWGMSKDLGIAGFRFGVIHTKNTDVLKVLSGMGIYIAIPSHIQELGAKMLADKKWLEEVYFPNNLSRLKSNYDRFKSFLQSKHNINVRKASAGFFIWANFSRFLPEKTIEEEMKLFHLLFYRYKLYIIPASQMSSNNPGWFRIVITINQGDLKEFEKRFDKFVSSFHFGNNCRLIPLG